MRFASKMTASIVALLCLTLSAGGAWTIRRNVQNALSQAAAQYEAQHRRERFALETVLEQTGSDRASLILQAADLYERELQITYGAGATPFAVLGEQSLSYRSTLDGGILPLDELAAIEAGENGCRLVAVGKRRYLLMASALGGTDKRLWLLNAFDVTALFAERDRQLRDFLLLECAALALAGAAAAGVSALLTRPLRALAAASRRIAGGEYNVCCTVETNDELGELGARFNEMARAVQENVAALQEESARQKRFVASFTHELKTPMTSILGYADRLRSAPQTPENRQRAANHIYREAGRLEALSREMLLLLGLEQGGAALAPTPLAAVLKDVRRSLPQLEAPLVFECPKTAAVLANRPLLVTLVRNLVLNAAAAGPPQSPVQVRCTPCAKGWELCVQDEGPGIPPEELARVFEPFYRIDKSRSRQSGGSGLGLSICREIAAAHGGQLRLESEPGRGTRASVRLREAAE